jgi:hypothetical protein
MVGPLVTAVRGMSAMGCLAAHPFSDAESYVVDVETGRQVALAPPAADAARLGAQARALMLGKYPECVEDTDNATLWSTSAGYNPRGALLGRYTFTMSAPYVCGTGPGHYSVAEDVSDRVIPAAFAPWRRLPSWAAPLVAAEKLEGVSPLPDGLDLDQLRDAFKAPAPRRAKPKKP